MPDDSHGGVPVADNGSHAGPPGGSNPAAGPPVPPPVGMQPEQPRRNASVVLAATGGTDLYIVPAAVSGLDEDIEVTAAGTAMTKKAAAAVREAAEREGVVLREIEETP